MRNFCDRVGLRQLVREPTRDVNLLDLALTDLDDVRCKVLGKLADHKGLSLKLPLQVPRVQVQARLVWHFRSADWEGLLKDLSNRDWSWISFLDADNGAEQLTHTILKIAEIYIPRRWLYERKSTHPWINERVLHIVREKIAAQGKHQEDECRKRCSAIIIEEYGKYVARERNCLRELPKGAKAWWCRSRRLMQKKGVVSSVPALKNSDDEWILPARDKADLFVDSFSKKCVLPDGQVNEYTPIPSRTNLMQSRLKRLQENDALHVLEKLRVDSGTGPDLLPARILKVCAGALAKPVFLLTMVILSTGVWPNLWRQHWVAPLFKRKSIYQANNYRGIHLTAQLSKVVERLLKLLYDPFLCSIVAFGPCQFAYTRGRGARDALAFLSLTWIIALGSGRKIAVYCSDVSGAFDRVSLERLVSKLEKVLHPQLLAVMKSWLRARSAHVVVGGESSKVMALINMVFQGTVTGPILWNLFF